MDNPGFVSVFEVPDNIPPDQRECSSPLATSLSSRRPVRLLCHALPSRRAKGRNLEGRGLSWWDGCTGLWEVDYFKFRAFGQRFDGGVFTIQEVDSLRSRVSSYLCHLAPDGIRRKPIGMVSPRHYGDWVGGHELFHGSFPHQDPRAV